MTEHVLVMLGRRLSGSVEVWDVRVFLCHMCVEPAGLCGRCTGVAVPLLVVPSPPGLPSKTQARGQPHTGKAPSSPQAPGLHPWYGCHLGACYPVCGPSGKAGLTCVGSLSRPPWWAGISRSHGQRFLPTAEPARPALRLLA